MVATVNQCTLSQTDFDFMTKANLITELTDKIQVVSGGFFINSFLILMLFVGPALIMVLSVMVRKYDKKASNILLVMTALLGIAVIGSIIMATSPYRDFNKTDAIDVQLHEAKAELKTMEKPDVEIVDACSHPDVILKLAPNRDDADFKSSYKPIVITE